MSINGPGEKEYLAPEGVLFKVEFAERQTGLIVWTGHEIFTGNAAGSGARIREIEAIVNERTLSLRAS